MTTQLLSQPIANASASTIRLDVLGFVLSGLLVTAGLVYQTYTIAVTPAALENSRQFGFLFLAAELGVIFFALSRGLPLATVWKKLNPSLRVALGIFLATFWIGGATASAISPVANIMNASMVIHMLFALSVFHCVERPTLKCVNGMAKWLFVGMIIFAIITAVVFLTPPSNPREIDWAYAVPGFISVRLFGALCGASLCFLIYLRIINEKSHSISRWLFAAIILFSGMTVWSGTRAAVLSCTVTLSAMTLLYRFRPSLREVFQILLCISTGGALAVLFIPYDNSAFMLFAHGDLASTEAASSGRLSLWMATWDAFGTVPVFGAGPAATSWILPVNQASFVQPHNILLQFLISWGAIATFAALFLLGWATWRAHFIAAKHHIVLPYLAMLDCLLINSLFDGTFHFAQLVMVIMVCYGTILAAGKSSCT